MASTVAHYENENMEAYERQVHAAQVHAAQFHEHVHVIRVSLNDGRRMRVAYPAGEQSRLIAQLKAQNVPVVAGVFTPPPPQIHHKLRYIIGGVVVAAAVIALIVLLLRRRHAAAQAGY